jgi:hypothetical protein
VQRKAQQKEGCKCLSEDIEHNRRGLLSPAQAQVVLSMDYAAMSAIALPVVGLTVGLGAMGWAHRQGSGVAYLVAAAIGVVALALGVLGMFATRARSARKAQQTPVVAMDGTVSWNGHKWVAHGHGPAGAVELVTFPLPPGPFRFYVHDGRIVGAESRLGPGSFSLQQILAPSSLASMQSMVSTMTPLPVGDRPALLGALAQTLGFSDQDLEANRRGALTPRQGQGTVTAVEGEAQYRWKIRSKLEPAHSFIVIGGHEIRMPHALAAVFVPGLRYRLYLRAGDGALVSLEPL